MTGPISESGSIDGAEARISLNDEFIDGAQVRIVSEKNALQLEWTVKTTESYRFLMREKQQLGQQLEQRLSKTVAINIVSDF